MKVLKYHATSGIKDLPLGLEDYRKAEQAGLPLPQYLANTYPDADPKFGGVFQQACAQAGLILRSDRESGMLSPMLSSVLHASDSAAGGLMVRDGISASRYLFPAAVLATVEDKLKRDLSTAQTVLNSMISLDTSINSEKFERMVTSYNDVETSDAAQYVAQGALPPTIMRITASDVSVKIPSRAFMVDISDQAVRGSTIDMFTLSIQRWLEVQGNNRAFTHFLTLLNGNSDYGMSSLSSRTTTAVSLDAAATTGLTHASWIKWLAKNQASRTITHVVTDLNGYLAIEGRAGQPTSTNSGTAQGIGGKANTTVTVANPLWPTDVKVFIIQDARWPAGTIMGLDRRYAILRVTSALAAYSAIENVLMKRTTQMRMDVGDLLMRQFDDAFDVLTYTPT